MQISLHFISTILVLLLGATLCVSGESEALSPMERNKLQIEANFIAKNLVRLRNLTNESISKTNPDLHLVMKDALVRIQQRLVKLAKEHPSFALNPKKIQPLPLGFRYVENHRLIYSRPSISIRVQVDPKATFTQPLQPAINQLNELKRKLGEPVPPEEHPSFHTLWEEYRIEPFATLVLEVSATPKEAPTLAFLNELKSIVKQENQKASYVLKQHRLERITAHVKHDDESKSPAYSFYLRSSQQQWRLPLPLPQAFILSSPDYAFGLAARKDEVAVRLKQMEKATPELASIWETQLPESSDPKLTEPKVFRFPKNNAK